MPEAFRVDRGVLGEGRIDHNGNLIVRGVLTRTGVFTYRHTDKDGSTHTTRELRHPDDVFDAEAVASFAQAPVTDDHPGEGRVTPANVKRYSVGNLGDSLSREGPQDNLVAADLIIRDDTAIAKALGRNGQPPKRFLSCGYKADVVPEEGEYMGERYDHRQTNIRGNHVALVRTPRAGPVARLLLDSEDAVLDDADEWLSGQEAISKLIEDALDAAQLELLDDKQREQVSSKISKLAHEHPDWENDRVVAAAYSMLGLARKKDEDDDTSRVIGQTRGGLDVHANHQHNEGDWSVDDHKEAAYHARDEHSRLRDTLATAQRVGLGDDAEGKIKAEMKTLKRTHNHHKKEAMTLDSNLVEDEDGWLADDDGQHQPPAGDDHVKIKRDAVSIGSGNNTLHLDDLTITVDEESEQALEVLLNQRDELIEFARAAHTDAEQARGERDAALAQITDPTKLDALAAERAEILDVAEFAGLKRDTLKSITNDEIKRQIVAKRNPDLLKEDSSDDYVQGCFNMIKQDSQVEQKNRGKFRNLRDVAAPHREDVDSVRADGGEGDQPQPTYREAALSKLRGVHSDSAEQLRAKGFEN